MDAQQATSLMAFGANNSANTNVGGELPNINPLNNGNDDQLVTSLRALGHSVNIAQQSSGLVTIVRRSNPQGNFYLAGSTRGVKP